MRITKNQLRQIIKEELSAVIREDDTAVEKVPVSTTPIDGQRIAAATAEELGVSPGATAPADLVASLSPNAKLVQYKPGSNIWIDESAEGLSRIYAKNKDTGQWETQGTL